MSGPALAILHKSHVLPLILPRCGLELYSLFLTGDVYKINSILVEISLRVFGGASP